MAQYYKDYSFVAGKQRIINIIHRNLISIVFCTWQTNIKGHIDISESYSVNQNCSRLRFNIDIN